MIRCNILTINTIVTTRYITLSLVSRDWRIHLNISSLTGVIFGIMGDKRHMCRPKCSRGSGVGISKMINCYWCKNPFHTLCFNLHLNLTHQKAFFDEGSPVQFICFQCRKELTKLSTDMNQNSHSLKIHSSKKPIIDKPIETNSKTSDTQLSLNKLHEDIVSRLNTFEKGFNNILTTALNKDKDKENENDSSTIQNILNEVTKTSLLLPKIASSELVKDLASNICSTINAKLSKTQTSGQNKSLLNKALLQAASDPLFEYSSMNDSVNSIDVCEGRPSFIFKQTVDDNVLDIMKSSEETITWKTLDIIHNKVKDNGESLLSIKDYIMNAVPVTRPDLDPNSMRSPLVKTVIHEAIEQISSDISFIRSSLTRN